MNPHAPCMSLELPLPTFRHAFEMSFASPQLTCKATICHGVRGPQLAAERLLTCRTGCSDKHSLSAVLTATRCKHERMAMRHKMCIFFPLYCGLCPEKGFSITCPWCATMVASLPCVKTTLRGRLPFCLGKAATCACTLAFFTVYGQLRTCQPM
jgi:hypothetical protein